MPSDASDYLKKRAAELGLDRGGVLERVQAWLDQQYPGQARAVSLNDGVLRLATASASLASELRLRQTDITELAPECQRVAISPSGL